MKCDRCGKVTNASTVSMFNTQEICMVCKEREVKHPRYAEAREREIEAVRGGDRNFPGIGLPLDIEN